MQFSEQNGKPDDKLKSAAEQQDNACHLSEDVGSWAIKDSGFIEDFKVFFYGAI